MRKCRVKISCVILVKMADSIKSYNLKKTIHNIIKDNLEEEYWKVEKLKIEKLEEINGKRIEHSNN